MQKVLIVEDETVIKEGLITFLSESFITESAFCLNDALKLVQSTTFDLILIDINLPDGSGISLAKYCARLQLRPKMIFLSAINQEETIISSLALTDDYITKPFRMRILLAKINKILGATTPVLYEIQVHDLRLLLDQPMLYVNHCLVELTPTEYRLLRFFMQHPNHLLEREQLFAAIWDNEERFINDNTLSVTIKRLRQKIEPDSKRPYYLKTIRGMGYYFDAK